MTSAIEPDNKTPAPARWTWGEAIFLMALLAAAAALRLWGIRFGFPETVRPDEEYFANIVRAMDAGGWNPRFYYYPHFFMHFNLLIWRAWVAVQMLTGNFTVNTGVQKFLTETPYILYLFGRYSSAFFGVASVWLLHAMTRRIGGRAVALAAAAFLAVNPTHALNSHFYKSDIVAGFFILAALHAITLALHGDPRHGARRLTWAGIWAGLALSCNYYGGFLGMPLMLAMAIHYGRAIRHIELAPDEPGLARFFRGGLPWGPIAAMLLAFFLTSPYVFLDYHGFLKDIHRMLFADRVNLYNTLIYHKVMGEDFKNPLLYSFWFCWRYTMGVGLLLLSAAGLVRGFFTRRPGLFVTAVFTLFFLLMTSTGKAVFVRYYAPATPLLCLLAAALLGDLGRWFIMRGREQSVLRAALLGAAAIALIIQPAAWTIQSNRILTQKDTRTLAREYLEREHILPPRAKIASPLDYRYGKPQVQRDFQFVKFLPNREALASQNATLIVWDEYWLRLYSPAPKPHEQDFLDNETELLAEFSPVAEGKSLADFDPVVDQLDAFYLPIARFEGVVRPGPLIRIYALKDADGIVRKPGADIEGLRATYYASKNFEGEKVVRIDETINFDWKSGAPMGGIPSEHFSVIWEGKIQAPVPGLYTFFLSSDDGSRLYINDTLVIDHWGTHGPEEKTGTIVLSNEWNDFRVEYFEDTFGASCRLMWQYDSMPKAVVPRDRFRPK